MTSTCLNKIEKRVEPCQMATGVAYSSQIGLLLGLLKFPGSK